MLKTIKLNIESLKMNKGLAVFIPLLLVLLHGCQTTGTDSLGGATSSGDIVKQYTSRGKPIAHIERNDGVTTFPISWELPEFVSPPLNDATLSFYFNKWLGNRFQFGRYEVQPKGNAVSFQKKIASSSFLEKQLEEKSILSYLYYDSGELIYDALAPSARFDFKLDNATEFRSNSVGKSFVSYLVGHAICEGYITSVDVPLNDWLPVRNTLYEGQRLIDLLNMRARDQHIVNEDKGFIKSGRWFNTSSVHSLLLSELQGTEPNSEIEYNYHGFATNLVMNYMIFKVGDDWQNFLNRVFQDKVKIEHQFFFAKNPPSSGWYSSYATRYDYLRIAVAMLEDWKNNTCVGRYLKEVHARRQKKTADAVYFRGETPRQKPQQRGIWSRTYGGQFHFDWIGLEDLPIIGMDGYGGQSILIDPVNLRIVVTNTITTNFDWSELVYEVIKNGRLKN